MFKLIARHSGQVVGTYSTVKRARAAQDRKDNEYGCYNHSIRNMDGTPA